MRKTGASSGVITNRKKLQRFVERIPRNVKWVIRLAGGNEYTEGTKPPPLEPGKEEPGDIAWRDWCSKTTEERQADIQAEAEHNKLPKDLELEDLLSLLS